VSMSVVYATRVGFVERRMIFVTVPTRIGSGRFGGSLAVVRASLLCRCVHRQSSPPVLHASNDADPQHVWLAACSRCCARGFVFVDLSRHNE